MYVCMYVGMYVRMYVCMYVCMYIYCDFANSLILIIIDMHIFTH